jgi:7-cyano-7-deazaguanine synthase in queuosine biosynthesis
MIVTQAALGNVYLVSGGLDSTAMVLGSHIGPEDTLLFVNYGQPYAMQEWEAACRIFKDVHGENLKYASISGISRGEDGVFIPARNMLLASVAVAYGDTIFMAGLKDDHVVDKSPAAFAMMGATLSMMAGYEISVQSPFWEVDKFEMIHELIQEQEIWELPEILKKLELTFSCYTPEKAKDERRHCMNCEACLRRAVVLHAHGVELEGRLSNRILNQYLRTIDDYEQVRQWTLLRYIADTIKPVVAVDIDGTLTDGVSVYPHYERAVGNPKAIHRVRRLAADNIIVCFTARSHVDRDVTVDWLNKHLIPFDALITNKIPYNLFCDDRTLSKVPKKWSTEYDPRTKDHS